MRFCKKKDNQFAFSAFFYKSTFLQLQHNVCTCVCVENLLFAKKLYNNDT